MVVGQLTDTEGAMAETATVTITVREPTGRETRAVIDYAADAARALAAMLDEGTRLGPAARLVIETSVPRGRAADER